jgi:hypothetical protein
MPVLLCETMHFCRADDADAPQRGEAAKADR